MDGQEPAGRPSFFRKPGTSPAARVAPPPASRIAPPPAPPAAPPDSPPRPPVGPPVPPLPGPGPETPGPGMPGSTSIRRPTFNGAGGTLFGIHVVNVLLMIVTLGIYYFWAKTLV